MPTPVDRSPAAPRGEAERPRPLPPEADERWRTQLEDERRAIARELHDGLGGALAAVRFDLSWIGRHATEPGVLSHAEEALRMLEQAIATTRQVLQGLRTDALASGLRHAVHRLADDCRRRTGIPVVVAADPASAAFPPDIELAVYRTLQESLTNAVRHAGCGRIEIALSDRSGCLTLEVADDGRGLPPDAWTRAGAFGLAGLRERAAAVGGWLDVASRPQGGTLVALAIPLDIHPSTGPQELSS